MKLVAILQQKGFALPDIQETGNRKQETKQIELKKVYELLQPGNYKK
jgi:hypothetical protein